MPQASVPGPARSEEERLCPTRHLAAASGAGRGCPKAQGRLAPFTSPIPLPRGSEAIA